MKSIQKRTLESSFAGLLTLSLNFVQSIFIIPIFLKYWDNSKYGMLLLVTAFLGLIRTFDIGHQTYVGNEFNKLFHTDTLSAKKTIGSGVRFCLILGFLQFLFFVIIYTLGISSYFIGTNINNQPNMFTGIIFMLIHWWFFGCIGGLLVRMILPIGKYAQATYFGLILKTAEILLMMVVAFLNIELSTYFIGLSLISIIYTFFLFLYIKNLLPEYFPWWQEGSYQEGWQNFLKSTASTINNFIEQFNTNNGVFLTISATFGAAALPIFTTQKTISNLFSQLTTLFVNPLTPDIIRFHAKGEYDKIFNLFKINWLVNTIIVNLPLIILLPFIKTVFELWTHGKLIFNEELFLCLATTVSIINYSKIFYVYLSCINHVKSILVISLVKFLVLFTFLFLFANNYGWLGIGLSIILSEFIGGTIFPFFYVRKLIPLDLKSVLFCFLPTLMLLLVSIWTIFNMDKNNYFAIIIGILTILIIAFYQWKCLPTHIKSRFYDVLPHFNK